MNFRRLGSTVAFVLAVLWLCAGGVLIWSALSDRQAALSATDERPVELPVGPREVSQVRHTVIGCFVLAGVFGGFGFVLRRQTQPDN